MVKGSMAVCTTPQFGVFSFVRGHDKPDQWEWTATYFPGGITDPSILPSLKLTQHLKMDGWETNYFYFGNACFQGQAVSFREGNFFHPSRQETKPFQQEIPWRLVRRCDLVFEVELWLVNQPPPDLPWQEIRPLNKAM